MNKNQILKNQWFFGISILLIAIGLSACGPSATNTTTTNGSSNTGANAANAKSSEPLLACDDVQVIKDMKAEIAAKHPLLESRIRHVSAYSKGCVVALMGYTDTLDLFKEFVKVAADTPNVRKVEIDRLYIDKGDVSSPGACGAGEVPCGDICVRAGQCWLMEKETNSNRPSNSNSNTTSNSNSNSNSAPRP
jgi:hypothetical protein